jgi:hypothetical protein
MMLSLVSNPVYYPSAGIPDLTDYTCHHPALQPQTLDSALRASLADREYLFAHARRGALGRKAYLFADQCQQDFLSPLSHAG